MSESSFSIRRYSAITAILMVLVMTVLDVTVVNVALPLLAPEFGVSDSSAVWIVTVYQLVITMLLLPVSSLGDLFSYRRCFLVGVALFTLASALCAASQSFAMIIMARALQGIGAACVMGVNIALTRLIYPREVLGRGLALNAMVIAIATAAGPPVAGALLSVASWHWLFIINIPFGIIAFIVGRRHLPANPPRSSRGHFDLPSALMNMAVFGLIFYALGSFARKGDLLTSCLLLAAGIALGYLYVRRQLRLPDPMLPVDLLRIRLYTLSIFTSTSSFIAQNMASISLPFLFLSVCGFSEITTGLLMTPWPIATIVTAPLAARFVERHNAGLTASCGMLTFALGITLLLFLPEGASEWNIVWRMALCGVGFGFFQTPNNIVMVTATPVARTGGAGGMQSTARLVGQTLGATLVTLIFALTTPSSNVASSVHATLLTSIIFALIAATFSLSRLPSLHRK